MEKVIICSTASQVDTVIDRYNLEKLREIKYRLHSEVKEGQVAIFIEQGAWEPMEPKNRFVSFFEWDMDNKGQKPLEKDKTIQLTP